MNKQEKILVIVAVIGLICAVTVCYFIATNYVGKNTTYLSANDDTFNVPKNSRVEVTSGNRIYSFLYEKGHVYASEYTLSGDVISANDIEVPRSTPYTFKSPLTGFTFKITEITDAYVTIDIS
jgi:heme/copper-type cytochrome/quinol oxidase subunit 2